MLQRRAPGKALRRHAGPAARGRAGAGAGGRGRARAGARCRAQWVDVRPGLVALADPAGAPGGALAGVFGGEERALREGLAAGLRERQAEEQLRALRGAGRFGAAPAAVAAGSSPRAAAAAAAALREDGVAFLRGVVPEATRAALAARVDACCAQALTEVGPGLRRIDWKLELGAGPGEEGRGGGGEPGPAGAGAGALVREALRHACGPGGVAAVLAGVPEASAAARLVELSVLCTEPGAPRQLLHPDMVFSASHAPLFTAFVALQDVEPEMGPTTFLLGTHRDARLQRLRELGSPGAPAPEDGALLREARAVAPALSAGDAVLYDARVLHAGGANRLRRRGLLTFSFLRPPIPPFPERHSAGAAFSILPGVLARSLSARDLAAGAGPAA